uniref:RNA helicase n=1 Tax=Kryptolebias marmoratus TaxID=37003 RepID=A0A3Q3A4F7_KRYMA
MLQICPQRFYPSCLWGRVVWGPGGVAGTKDHYDTLQAQMNLFYHDVTQDLSRLKPALLEEGQAYVVYWAVKKSWCRAVMESVIIDSISCQYCTLSPADRYSWPAVARGYNTVIISHNTEQPLSYLAPLLSHIQLNSVFTSFTSSLGPIAVLLCPGWERAQMVYDMLEESKVSQTLHPVIILVGIGKNEAKAVKIPKNCLLLVTTPFTLVRLLSCHCFMFLRVYHLVLDKAEELFALEPVTLSFQMDTILQHFQKVTCSEETFCPKQLVVVAKRWTNHMETLIGSHMPSPYIIISVPEEAALYGNVQQVILMTLESNKIQVLLGALDFSPAVGQKSLIVTNSVQEVEDVFKAVSNKSAFCLKTHEGLTHQFDFVMEQWRKEIGPGTNVILVTTNDCLKCLGIKDATCLIHHGFPTSPKVFGSRLFCMAENFRNLCEGSNSQVLRSVLLPSERNASHIVGVLRYLKRTNALLPPELLAFAQGVHAAREDQKMDRPLCSYLKRFGFCSKDSGVCPDRHQFHCQLDKSVLPASGVIEVRIIWFYYNTSVFFGRMVKKDDKCFDIMASEMVSYYADKKPGAKELLEGCLYAVQEDEVFHRSDLRRDNETLFFTVLVVFIDVGKEDEVKSHQIFQLPEQFQSLPGQAIEVIICRVKPADAEINWHPKVTRTISQKVRGLQHQARAVLSLGNTVFVDPMVITKVPGMKTFINEYNVQSEILNTGMAISNPDHLDLLRELCEKVCDQKSQLDIQTASRQRGTNTAELMQRFVIIHPSSTAYVLLGHRGNRSRPPSPQLHSPVPPGRSQGVPKPESMHNPSSRFWVCPGVPSHLDMTGKPLKGGDQASTPEANLLATK